MTTKNKSHNKKRIQQQTLFDEWQMMTDGVTEFRKLVWIQNTDPDWQRLEMFAIGFPRNFKIVATLQRNGFKFRKVVTLSIKFGSPETWFDRWDAAPWFEQ